MQEQNSSEKAKKVQSYYDNYVERQKRVGVNERHHSILKKAIEAGLNADHKVLEIGCGIGTFTSLLVQHVTKGKILSLDISLKSVEEAKCNLAGINNLEILHQDVTKYSSNIKFDSIILPDVLEHIPFEFHHNLFKKLSEMLQPDGFIFIHMPNPYYTEWVTKNAPYLLQVIDLEVTTEHLVQCTAPYGLFIHELKIYSIWIEEGDYEYVILKKKGDRDFGKIIPEKISFWAKLKYKLNGTGK